MGMLTLLPPSNIHLTWLPKSYMYRVIDGEHLGATHMKSEIMVLSLGPLSRPLCTIVAILKIDIKLL